MAISEGFKIFDPRLMNPLKTTNFKGIFKRALFRTLRGKARVTGSGDLIEIYPYIESEANKMGVAGVIKWGDKLMKVPVSTIEKGKNGDYKPKYFFQKSPSYNEYTTLTLELPVPKVDPKTKKIIGEELKEHIFYANRTNPLVKESEQLFAILENDADMAPDLEGIDNDLEKLELILDAIFEDVIKSKKRFYFTFNQDPDDEDWKKVNDMWDKGILGYITFPRSAQDVGQGEDGIMKEGIDPDKIELKIAQPENKGRDLWADYFNFRREMLWKYGVRIDILENKQERASVSEVEDSNSYFDNIDNERRQCRLNFINWVITNWGGKYDLTYK